MRKKILFVLSIMLCILTFIGAGYVLMNKGTVNAGYAMIPMLFTLISLQAYKKAP